MKTSTNSFFLFLFCFTFYCCPKNVQAQDIKLNAYSSYAFDDNVHTYDLDGTLMGGYMYGGGVEFKLGDFYGAELLYQRLDSYLPYRYYGSTVQEGTMNYGLNYIMFGSNRYLPLGRIEPFAGVLLGVAILDLKQQPISDITKFSWGFRLGSNINLSPRLALKLQAQLTSIVQSVGGGLYFGWGGVSPTLNTYSSVYQFNIGGALVVTLPNR